MADEDEWPTKTVYKTTDTHMIVSEAYAQAHPDTTVEMQVPEHATDIEPNDEEG